MIIIGGSVGGRPFHTLCGNQFFLETMTITRKSANKLKEIQRAMERIMLLTNKRQVSQ